MNNSRGDAFKRVSSPVVFLAAVVIAGGLLWPASGRTAAGAGENPSLAGTWKLNKDQSDNPREKMQEAMGNSGGGQGEGGGHHQGGQGGGSGQGGGGRHGGGMMEDMSQLTIVQTGSDIKITGASGKLLAALPAADTSAKPNDADANAPPVPSAHWQYNQLVTESQGQRRGKTTRTYALSSDGKQLDVTTRIESPRFSQPVTYRLVYDPVKSN